MENKVIIKLNLPEFNKTFDVFLPVNELIWKTKKMIVKSISDITKVSLNINSDYLLMNLDTGRIYKSNEIIINTDIRNGSELVMMRK